MIEPIFAWSSDGHGPLASRVLAAAIAQVVRLGKSDLMKRFIRLYREFGRVDAGAGRTAKLTRTWGTDPVPSVDQARPRSGDCSSVSGGSFKNGPARRQHPHWGSGSSSTARGRSGSSCGVRRARPRSRPICCRGPGTAIT